MRKKRHNYTPEEKVFILKRHLVGLVIYDLRKNSTIQDNLYSQPSLLLNLLHNAEEPHQINLMGLFYFYSRRRPTLPHSYRCSTIGPEEFTSVLKMGTGVTS